MPEQPPKDTHSADPLESFRTMRDHYLENMSKAMIDAVNSDAYAAANGSFLNNTLTMAAPMRESFEKSMLQMLQQLSLPSRQDLLSLAERFTNVEMRLDDMDARLENFEALTHKALVPILEQIVLLNRTVGQLGFNRVPAKAAKVATQPAKLTKQPAPKPASRTLSKARRPEASQAPLKRPEKRAVRQGAK